MDLFLQEVGVFFASSGLLIMSIVGMLYFIKQVNIICATIGYPAYFGLLAIETIFRKYIKINLFILNKPNSSKQLILDNVFAFLATVLSIQSLVFLLKTPGEATNPDTSHIFFKLHLIFGSIGFAAFIVLIYLHSRYEKDVRDITTKTQNIAIKNFF